MVFDEETGLEEGVAADEEVAPEKIVEPESPNAATPGSEFAEQRDKFAEGLPKSVIVPFPRRFADSSAAVWEAEPGNAVGLSSTLWDESPDGHVEELPEPGGSIPGLPLWEADDAGRDKSLATPAPERLEPIAPVADAGAQVLHATILVDVTEAARLATVCEREWRDSPSPAIEDVVFRAIALALRERSGEDAIGAMVIAKTASDVSSALTAPAAVPFREAIARRHGGGDAAFESASWVLVSVARHGVSSCTPRLGHGHGLAFALGAADASGRAALTVAFDGVGWSESSAARLLARIRELFESPYAMLI